MQLPKEIENITIEEFNKLDTSKYSGNFQKYFELTKNKIKQTQKQVEEIIDKSVEIKDRKMNIAEMG